MKRLLVLCSVLLSAYIGYRVYTYLTLDAGMDRLIQSGAIILDIRTASEFAMGHIDGSINISLGTIRERYVELDTTQTYITVCSHGLRSVKAEKILKEKGFRKVYNGGAWSDLEKSIQTSFHKKR